MSGCECAGCGEHFVSVESFDAHRRDATAAEIAADSWMRRRCLTAKEMATRGWERSPKGWRHPLAMRRMAQKAQRTAEEAA